MYPQLHTCRFCACLPLVDSVKPLGALAFLTTTFEFALLDTISIHACTFLYLFAAVTRPGGLGTGATLSCSSPSLCICINPPYLYLSFVFVFVCTASCSCHQVDWSYTLLRFTESFPKNSCFSPSAPVSNTISLQTKSKYKYKCK